MQPRAPVALRHLRPVLTVARDGRIATSYLFFDTLELDSDT